MTPFVQELISFISLMLGVIVLTAWVMWLLLRPSGDTKVKDFAQESARDGLTQCMIENNELHNKVTRLERKIKVLMSVGYGGAKDKEDEHEANDVGAKTAVERLKTKGEARRPENNIIAEGHRTKPAVAKETPQKATGEVTRTVVKQAATATATTGKQAAASAVKTGHKSTATSGTPSAPGSTPVQKAGTAAADARPVVKATATGKKKVTGSPAKAAVKPASPADSISAPPPTSVQKADEVENEAADDRASDELKRLIEEAEKEKITEYMANVEKAAERHKKQVEALAAKAEDAEKVRYANNNLKRIKGIGPHLEVMLKKSGITSYQQIAEFTEQDIERVSDEIGSFPRRIKREGWVEQAKKILGKD